jgi:hypothetical protein
MAGASAHHCVLSHRGAEPAITTTENGKTPLDLVSFQGASPQIQAKNRETAFVSRIARPTTNSTVAPNQQFGTNTVPSIDPQRTSLTQ